MFSTSYLEVLLILTVGAVSTADKGGCPPPSESCQCQALGDVNKSYVLDVNCEERNLKSLPPLQPYLGKPLVELDLKLNQIGQLPAEGFNGLKFKTLHKEMLPLLDLSSNPIKAINEDAFKGIIASTLELDLSDCALEVIPVAAISKIPNLVALLLKNNKLKSIPDDAFAKLKKLETIELSGNKKLMLNDKSFMGLEKILTNVSLNSIRLNKFPSDAVKSLTKLQQLSLDDNAITSLPAEIFKDFQTQSKLFRLSIKNNRMNFINSKAFLDMGNLRLESLNLRGNRLKGLDFLADPCLSAFTLNAFVKVRDNPVNCDCDVYSAIVTEYVHVDGKCTAPEKYAQFWLNPTVDDRFQNDAAIECQDLTNVTGVVTCPRDVTEGAMGLYSSLSVTIVSSVFSFLYVISL